jgi:2',3'-cyclic-nucleotide 2'-phosphodiesterase (5'-nucleotidase family)
MDKTFFSHAIIRQLFIVIALLTLLPFEGQSRETTLNILYTGAMNGELEPCECSPEADFGGLARISGYILRNRIGLYPYILIDAGNFSDRDSAQGRLKSEAVINSFTIMNYDAVAFMKNEKYYSDDFFASLIQRYKVPFVSDSYPCKRAVSISRGLLEVNISSVLDELKEDKLNILVTDKSAADLTTAEGWDVIISSSGEIIDGVPKVKGALFMSGYPNGKHLGILTLHVDEKGKVTKFKHRFESLGTDIQEDEMVRRILDEYDSKAAVLMKYAERPAAGTTYPDVSKCSECKVVQ